MKVFLETEKIYVRNSKCLIYKVESLGVWDSCDYIQCNLVLVEGYRDGEGMLPAKEFKEDLQADTVNCYIFKEGIENALERSGFDILRDYENY